MSGQVPIYAYEAIVGPHRRELITVDGWTLVTPNREVAEYWVPRNEMTGQRLARIVRLDSLPKKCWRVEDWAGAVGRGKAGEILRGRPHERLN